MMVHTSSYKTKIFGRAEFMATINQQRAPTMTRGRVPDQAAAQAYLQSALWSALAQ